MRCDTAWMADDDIRGRLMVMEVVQRVNRGGRLGKHQRVKRGQHSEAGRRCGRPAPTGEPICTQILEDKRLVKKGKIYWNRIRILDRDRR